jgi:tRNA(Ile)-lysidine synthase
MVWLTYLRVKSTIALAIVVLSSEGLEVSDQNFLFRDMLAQLASIFLWPFDTQAFANDYKLSTQVAAQIYGTTGFTTNFKVRNYDYVLGSSCR